MYVPIEQRVLVLYFIQDEENYLPNFSSECLSTKICSTRDVNIFEFLYL